MNGQKEKNKKALTSRHRNGPPPLHNLLNGSFSACDTHGGHDWPSKLHMVCLQGNEHRSPTTDSRLCLWSWG
ncbi:hypothetical protein OIU85_010081 [Salix viminalis]|uniref:Uncharacterized protein n=1 Tax=Salix viminalis TaxID=40686 RepID=A0A9Q0NVU6_SALVM|nr:hypothetical protein OIU85_010081 [Salix viminalis]